MNSLEERNKKVLLIIVVVGVIFLGIYKLFFEKKSENENIDTETIEIVTNQNDFFTVSSCVSRYINYLSASDNDKIYMLLGKEYKEKNNITKENLNNYIKYLDGIYSFNPKKMFVQRLGLNTYKYYVYGLISKESIDITPEESNFYISVILDRKNGTFAIEPYNGEIFE